MTEKTVRAGTKTDFAAKIEKVWKITAAVVGLLGMISTAASWGFSYAMSDRDRRVEDLTAEIATLNQHIASLQVDLRRNEERFNDDMQDVQVALSAIQIYLNRHLETEVATTSALPVIRNRSAPDTHALLIEPDASADPIAGPENEVASAPPDELLRNALERLGDRRAL